MAKKVLIGLKAEKVNVYLANTINPSENEAAITQKIEEIQQSPI